MTNYQHLVETHEIGQWIDTILNNTTDPNLCQKLGVHQDKEETPAQAVSRYMQSEYVSGGLT